MLQLYFKGVFIKFFILKSNFSVITFFHLFKFFSKLYFCFFIPSFFYRFSMFSNFYSNLFEFFFSYHFNTFVFHKSLKVSPVLGVRSVVLFDFFYRFRSLNFHLINSTILLQLQANLYYLVIKGSKRNSFVTFITPHGKVIKSFTCGQERDFKKSKKKMWYAHLRLAERVYQYILKYKSVNFVIIRLLNFKYQCRSILKFLVKSFHENKY